MTLLHDSEYMRQLVRLVNFRRVDLAREQCRHILGGLDIADLLATPATHLWQLQEIACAPLYTESGLEESIRRLIPMLLEGIEADDRCIDPLIALASTLADDNAMSVVLSRQQAIDHLRNGSSAWLQALRYCVQTRRYETARKILRAFDDEVAQFIEYDENQVPRLRHVGPHSPEILPDREIQRVISNIAGPHLATAIIGDDLVGAREIVESVRQVTGSRMDTKLALLLFNSALMSGSVIGDLRTLVRYVLSPTLGDAEIRNSWGRLLEAGSSRLSGDWPWPDDCD